MPCIKSFRSDPLFRIPTPGLSKAPNEMSRADRPKAIAPKCTKNRNYKLRGACPLDLRQNGHVKGAGRQRPRSCRLGQSQEPTKPAAPRPSSFRYLPSAYTLKTSLRTSKPYAWCVCARSTCIGMQYFSGDAASPHTRAMHMHSQSAHGTLVDATSDGTEVGDAGGFPWPHFTTSQHWKISEYRVDQHDLQVIEGAGGWDEKQELQAARSLPP